MIQWYVAKEEFYPYLYHPSPHKPISHAVACQMRIPVRSDFLTERDPSVFQKLLTKASTILSKDFTSFNTNRQVKNFKYGYGVLEKLSSEMLKILGSFHT